MPKIHLVILWLAVFAAVWGTSMPRWGGPGFTWDEAYYYPPFHDVEDWTRIALFAPSAALTSEGIWTGWQEIHELPPLIKWLGAAAISFVPERGWLPVIAMRILPAAAFALSLVLMILIGERLGDRRTGTLAAALYAMFPRVFGHAQIAATESIFVAVMLFTIWVALHDLGKWRWRIALAVACGLALATKVNGIVLTATIFGWLLTRRVADGKWRRPIRMRLIRSDALSFILIVVIAPVVALAIWPWMWDHTAARVEEYILFIRHHAYQGIWYFGRKLNFTEELAPASYPFVMFHLTTPVWLLILFWAGIISAGWRSVRRLRIQPGLYLLLAAMLAPFAASSLPSTPKYDGVRLFLPAFAPAMLVAAKGLVWIWDSFRRRIRKKHSCSPALAVALPVIAVLLQATLLRPTIDYYNAATRFLTRNEPIFPFEQTYWGNAVTPQMLDDLNKILPPNARVKTRAIHTKIFTLMQDWGELRGDIRFDPDPPYDAHLIQTRRGFWGNADWSIYESRIPLESWGNGVGGEPLIYLYDGRPPGK